MFSYQPMCHLLLQAPSHHSTLPSTAEDTQTQLPTLPASISYNSAPSSSLSFFSSSSSSLSSTSPSSSINLRKRKREPFYSSPQDKEIVIGEYLEAEYVQKPWKRREIEDLRRKSKAIWPGRGRRSARIATEYRFAEKCAIRGDLELKCDYNNMDRSLERIYGGIPPLSPENQALFDPAKQSRSRGRSESPTRTTRQALSDLKVASPSVNVIERHLARSIPNGVQRLLHVVAKDIDVNFIPGLLSEQLQEVDDLTPSTAFDADSIMPAEEATRLWNKVVLIHDEAHSCADKLRDENAWNMEVVERVLGSDDTKSFVRLFNIQTQLIDPEFLSIAHGTPFVISRKADYALGFSSDHPEIDTIYKSLTRLCLGNKRCQMSDTFTSGEAIFAGLEVKTPAGSKEEAILQTSIHLAAGLVAVKKYGQIENPEFQLPLCGWTVVGHEWEFYVATFDANDGNAIKVIGPFEQLRCTTHTHYGVLKLLHLVDRVKGAWGREIYWPWLNEQVYKPLIARGRR